MPAAVFISYARRASAGQAQALAEALRCAGISVFLDTTDIEDGTQFPEAILNGLLGCRMFVAFPSTAYFDSWYCLRELRTALAPYDADLRAGATDAALNATLNHIVLAGTVELENLPPLLRVTDWPQPAEVEALVALIGRRLGQVPDTLDARLRQPEAARIRATLLGETLIPPPGNLAGIRMFHPTGQFDQSLRDRFVGRATELARIHLALSTMRGDPARSATLSARVTAGGGYGKTTIANEYLWRYGQAYFPGGIFWLNAAADRSLIEDQWHGVLRALRYPVPVPSLLELRQQKVDVGGLLAQALGEANPVKPILFVLDNLPATTPPVALSDFCPALGVVTVLATSRQETAERSVMSLRIDVLERPAAVELLRHELDNPGALGDAEWGRIAAWVGDLPLVLDQLNIALKLKAVAPRELLRKADDPEPARDADEIAVTLRDFVPANAVRGISEALSISFDRLDADTKRAACLIAQLAPDALPIEIIDAMQIPPKVRLTLKTRHFVRGEKDGTFGAMHRVMASYLRRLFSSDQAVMAAAVEAVFGVLSERDFNDPSHWPLFDACSAHATTLFERAISGSALDPNTVGIACELAGIAASARSSQGDFAGARNLEHRVLKVCRRLLGDEHLVTLRSMNNLACTLRSQGDLSGARKLYEQALEVRRSVQEEEHPDTLTSMGNLASMLAEQGDLTEARKLQERVLEVHEQSLGDEHPVTLTSMNNLAGVMRQQGDLAGACKLHERALDARRRVLGEEHPHTLLSMRNLASTLGSQGDLAGARKLQERVLEVSRRVLGEEHPDTLSSMNNLASTLSKQGEVAQARTLLKRAYEISLRTQGETHPLTRHLALQFAFTTLSAVP